MKRSLQIGGIAFASLIVLGFFQNCAKSTAGFTPTAASSTTGVTPLPNPSPVAAQLLFKAGDNFNPAVLGCTPTGGLAAGLPLYAALTGFKAIAIAANCSGFIASFYDIATQAEADRMAMQACQVASGNQPCAVIAEGNLYKTDSTTLKASYTSSLTLGLGSPTLIVGNVPFITAKMQTFLTTYYVNSPAAEGAFKAFAIYPNGAVGMGFSTASQASANKNALQRCQGFARMQPCMLYAQGTSVVYGQTSFVWSPPPSTLNLSLTALATAQIPFLEDKDITTLSAVNLSTDTIYITPLGGYAYAATAAAAKAACITGDGTITYLDPCLLYSTNGVVSLTAAQIAAAGNAPVSPITAVPTFTLVNTILQASCVSCHSTTNASGGVSFSSYTSTLTSLSAKNAAASPLYTEVANGAMPRGAAMLSAAQIALIQGWINAGALNN